MKNITCKAPFVGLGWDMRIKYHPELPLGPKTEKGTAQTFVFHLLDRKVDLPDTKEWKIRIDAAKSLFK